MPWLDALTAKALDRERPTQQEALAVLTSSDDELLDVVAAAFRVRQRFFGRRVKLNFLVNVKSGLCPEDCFYCSQRLGSGADVLKYSWLKPDEVLSAAQAGVSAGAKRVCLVASGVPSKGIRKFTGTESGDSPRNAKATSTRSSSVSPMPAISPEQGDRPADLADSTVDTRSAYSCVVQMSA